MAENTAPFRNITRKDHPLKISPVSIGAVRSSMIPPAYRPRRLPPMICPAINCHNGVGRSSPDQKPSHTVSVRLGSAQWR